jgi:hypothetical protein
MPDIRDFLPMPPPNPPVPRGWVRRYAIKFEYHGKEIWHYPRRPHIYAIPKEIRLGPGIKPSDEELATYIEIWELTKSPVGFSLVDDFVVLSGYSPEKVYQHLTWLVKNQKAIMNIDRWGNVVYIKLRRKLISPGIYGWEVE